MAAQHGISPSFSRHDLLRRGFRNEDVGSQPGMDPFGLGPLERLAAELLQKENEKFKRLVDDLTRPSREMQAQVDAALKPYKAYGSLMEELFRSNSSGVADTVLKSLSGYSLAGLSGIPFQIAEGLKVPDPYETAGMHRDAMKALISGFDMTALEAAVKALRPSVANLEGLMGSFGTLGLDSGALNDWSAIARKLQGELTAGEIMGSSDPQLTEEELEEAAADLSAEVEGADNAEDLLLRLIRYLDRVSGRPRKAVALLVLTLFLNVLGNLLTPLAQPWWKRVTGLTAEKAESSVRHWGRETYGEGRLADYRIVIASRLNVRASDSPVSESVSRLRRGEVVRVLSVNSGRTRVEFFDSKTHLPRIGWVASRFLAKF